MFKVELRNHLAQARHPFTKEPLFDDKGEPVPLFPEQRSIFVDGVFCGYVGEPPKRGIMFTRPRSQLGEMLIKEVERAVAESFGAPSVVSAVPERVETETDFGIEEDD